MTDFGKYIVAVLVPVVLMMACSTASNDGAGSVSFAVIGSGDNLADGTADTKIFETYADQVTFDNAANLYSLSVEGEVIDFASNQVVLITMGTQNNGGYTIAAERVRDVGDYLELNILLSSPGADCINTLAITHPYQVLKVNSLKEVRTS